MVEHTNVEEIILGRRNIIADEVLHIWRSTATLLDMYHIHTLNAT